MIYLDSSALLKLLHEEEESAALVQWLGAQTPGPRVSSVLARIEVIRACRRVNERAVPAARALISGLDLVPLTADVATEASEVGGTALRSLDAIHLASALSIRAQLSAFVAYDHRLLEAAANVGLDPVQPGI